MKRYYALLPLLVLLSCGRFGAKEGANGSTRIVCLSKQYNEIIYALGAEQDLVGVRQALADQDLWANVSQVLAGM